MSIELNDDYKLQMYDKLNSIKVAYFNIKHPFNIISDGIKFTHNKIKLNFIKDKNYFVKADKERTSNSYKDSNKPKHAFTPEETAAYLERKNRRENGYTQTSKFTPEETAAYLERKNRREQSKHQGGGVMVLGF